MKWTDVLPGMLRDNPEVIVTLIPDDARPATQEFEGHTLSLVLLPSGEYLGLQVVSSSLDDWPAQSDVMHRAGYNMARPVFVGPLSSLPQRTLLHDGLCPVIVLRYEMSKRFFNIKSYYIHKNKATNDLSN